ncbi:ApbA-domain-containing protein [Tilletiaria anomala UBC 951]|uniref:ApbA-domain-containing protein n=1 Tax=Tilletiaria anomala (strain ATCC 24038 / CBS 436.72 / UBC 951) TaxID=1037660 RepID=A0A066WQY7_TILAU|nr:ApbA-domain-containing protein [Tilletiaria anomala UBC 951]KDN53060.1 ApbA-domain-containing protein [Tilletiaria anomala UBC 951]
MNSQREINIIYVGAGAVGCFYASRMVQGGGNVRVSMVCRSNYKAVKESGLTMQTRNFGDYHFIPHRVFPNVQVAASEGPDVAESASNSGKWDYVVVTTKALPDIVDESRTIAPIVSPPSPDGKFPGSIIVLIQNGVGVEHLHRERFPQNPIVSAVTVISAEQVSHGVVRQNRWTRISIGAFTDGIGDRLVSGDQKAKQLHKAGEDAVAELNNIWTAGGIKDVEMHDEKGLQLVRWHKLTINASMNPSAVLSGGTGNARMSLDAELRRHLQGVMDEIFAAAPSILGRPFPNSLATPEVILKSTERNTGSKPSMLLDWEADRPLELEVILGNPVRIARSKGVEMPRTQSLYALLKMAQTRKEERKKQQPNKQSKL